MSGVEGTVIATVDIAHEHIPGPRGGHMHKAFASAEEARKWVYGLNSRLTRVTGRIEYVEEGFWQCRDCEWTHVDE